MDQKMIDKYNPDKFRELTQSDIEAMRDFTMNDVADLAKAYPNKPTQRAYLVLFNKTDKAKQLYPLGTWQNLLALWKQQLTQYVAYNFAALHNNKKATGMPGAKTGAVQDLTQAEVTRAIKTVPKATPQTAKPQTAKPVVVDNGNAETVVDDDVNDTFDDLDHEAEAHASKTEPVKPAKKDAKKSAPKKAVKTVALSDKKKK